ncbi:hypothetical protein MMC26_001898 [Xylographa opegraphella]|nr:hypothetical protein [Xylographa opegraphella]
MAASVSAGLPLDPARNGKYPIIVSQRLLDDDFSPDSGLASVHLNHQPDISSSIRKTFITPSDSGFDNCDLTFTGESEHEKYRYSGSQQPSTACALIFNPETQTFTLDRIDADFAFNLRSTPTNKSAKSLAAQYTQLETNTPDPVSEEEDLVTEAEQADPDNPYDYRHYLKRPPSSSPEPIELESRNASPRPSLEPSPVPEVRQKPKPKPKPRQHRTQPPRASTPPREEADADNEESEDDGGLTVIMDPSNKPRHRFNANFNRNEPPRSLRSAASSVSPVARPEPSSSEESDEDEVVLRSPVQREESPMEGVQLQEEEYDDEDDDGGLEAELERELEKGAGGDEEGGGVSVTRYIAESSSESEEE